MDQHEKLFPSLTTKDRQNKPHIIDIGRMYNSRDEIQYSIIDSKTEKLIKYQCDDGLTLDEFINTFSFENVKAVIFNISDHAREHADIDFDVNRREKVAKKFQTMKVPYLFVNDKTYMAMSGLMVANIVPKIGERILTIAILIEDIYVIELLRLKDGYQVIEKREILCASENTNFEQLRTDILGKNSPTKFIVTSLLPSIANASLMDKLIIKILASKSVIINENQDVFGENSTEAMVKCACAIVRNMYDRNFTTFHIIPSCQAAYLVTTIPSINGNNNVQFSAKEYDILPKIHASNITRTNEPFDIFCYDKKKKIYKLIKTVQFDPYPNALRENMLLTFHIDENDIPFLYHHSKTEGQMMNLDTEYPVIGFFRNLTYIRIKNNGKVKQYQDLYPFLKTWGDKFGKQTFLSFEKEKPKLISKIDESCNMKCIIKVQDIIKVMSMPPDNIVIDPTWNFKIHSTPEDPVLIVFENFDGLLSSAPPPFLMALILKNLLKVIQQSTKIKPKQIGLYLIDENRNELFFRKRAVKYQFTKEEEERIENGFKEACKLINVECFCTDDICSY